MRLPFVIAIILACMACLWRCHGATTNVTPATLADACIGASPGDVVICSDGLLTGHIQLGTGPVSNITVRAQNKWGVKITCDPLSEPVVYMPKNGCTVDGFELTGSTANSGVYIPDGIKSNTVMNCWIHHCGTSGVDGIEAHNQYNLTIRSNLIEYCGNSLSSLGHGIYAGGTNIFVYGNVTRYNLGGAGMQVYQSWDRSNSDYSSNNVIFNNLSYGNGDHAINMGGRDTAPYFVFNNTFVHTNSGTVMFINDSQNGGQNAVVYITNNIIIGPNGVSSTTGANPNYLIGDHNYTNTTTAGLFVNTTNGLYWLASSIGGADTNVVPPFDFFGRTLGDSGELVRNPGFETGIFSPGWSASWPTALVWFAPYAHSGAYGAQVGPSTLGYLSQTLNTEAGSSYTLSCWLRGDGTTPNQFQIIFDGVTNVDLSDITYVGWTQFVFNVTATTSSTLMKFGFQNGSPSGYFGFDDVSVAKHGPGITDVGAFQYSVPLAFDTRVLDPSPITGANYWEQIAQSTWTFNFGSLAHDSAAPLGLALLGTNSQVTSLGGAFTNSLVPTVLTNYGFSTSYFTNYIWSVVGTQPVSLTGFLPFSGVITVPVLAPGSYSVHASFLERLGGARFGAPDTLRRMSIR